MQTWLCGCGAHNPGHAAICWRCGRAPASRKDNLATVLVGFVLICLLMWGFILFSGQPAAVRRPSERRVLAAAEELVKRALKSPRTAIFDRAEQAVVPEGERHWRVSGEVHSQNSFGALIRSFYECRLRFDPDQDAFFAEEFVFDGNTLLGKDPEPLVRADQGAIDISAEGFPSLTNCFVCKRPIARSWQPERVVYGRCEGGHIVRWTGQEWMLAVTAPPEPPRPQRRPDPRMQSGRTRLEQAVKDAKPAPAASAAPKKRQDSDMPPPAFLGADEARIESAEAWPRLPCGDKFDQYLDPSKSLSRCEKGHRFVAASDREWRRLQ